MKETKFKQTLVQTKEGSRHCEEHSDVAIQGGFKMTEVGMIPSDWEVKSVGQLTNVLTGFPFPGNTILENGNVRLLRGVNITEGQIRHSDDIDRFYSGNIESLREYALREDDLVIGMDGSKVGKNSAIIHKNESGNLLVQRVARLRVKNSKQPISYIFYFISSNNFIAYIDSLKTNSAIPHISPADIRNYTIPLPSKIEEQQRIANALSDVDTLIENLEKLIAKKKKIKQGAMQQLLTGHKRLPGFGTDNGHTDWFTPNGVHKKSIKTAKVIRSESIRVKDKEQCAGYKMTEVGMIPSDWEVKTIKDLGVFLGGGTPSTKNESFWKGNIPWISSADLNDDDIEHISTTRFITQEAVNCSATQICPQGTILIIARVGVGKLALSQQKVCTSQDFCNLIPSKENDSKFLAYALLPVMKQMANESQGTSIKGVAVDEIKKVQIIVPSSKAEQTAIANVLSDMDAEISALETKLAKYRTLKTGMMQQLLTGKIRLV